MHKKHGDSRNNIFLATVAHRLVTLVVPQSVSKLLQRAADQASLLPQVGGQETVGVGHSSKGGLQSVLKGLGRAGRRGVDILNTGKLEQTLNSGRSNQRSTTGGGDQLFQQSVKTLIIFKFVRQTWHLRGR